MNIDHNKKIKILRPLSMTLNLRGYSGNAHLGSVFLKACSFKCLSVRKRFSRWYFLFGEPVRFIHGLRILQIFPLTFVKKSQNSFISRNYYSYVEYEPMKDMILQTFDKIKLFSDLIEKTRKKKIETILLLSE